MLSTTTFLALALATIGLAAPAVDLEARQQQTNILLCKRLDCSGEYYVDQINLPVITGQCSNVPDIFEFRPVDFQGKIRAVNSNGGTSCFLYDQEGCQGTRSALVLGGRVTPLNVAPYNFDNRTRSMMCI
ncbi:hypothetical protein P280DRAFT_506395 [Massarina eburnea CBS 473.64]|uniref:Uncharacterized protein n=1 Tax=Massarina eburnea CBS 473.64 TaxID=1395130 RepID=A0A6A6S267_9PLEO|nr:hypothetical protein P280DRAFT_506395 [Massarina eburnea CBS 473.64]